MGANYSGLSLPNSSVNCEVDTGSIPAALFQEKAHERLGEHRIGRLGGLA
jgi:hypothetical protein